jgi:sigma-54 dependent transcriptional regulator, acetoin dehydrogenase operon transcriptional activator AcoR
MTRNQPAGWSVAPWVRDSWVRSRTAGVPIELARAPVGLEGDRLVTAREHTDWLGFASDAVRSLLSDLADDGHVLTLFDATGRMLASEGDPGARERLAEINFAPGGLWQESAVGTNGPGTALAAGKPVHVVGAEHYCEAWRPWHCAAAPIRDPASGEVCGVLDITGGWQHADPRLLNLVRALAVSVERAMAARHLERRCRILTAFSDIVARYPSDIVIAVDRHGTVVAASPSAPPDFRPAQGTSAPIRTALAALVAGAEEGSQRSARGLLGPQDESTAVVYPVTEGGTPVGAALLLRRSSHVGAHSRDRARRPTRYSFLDLMGQSSALAEASRIGGIAAANTLPVLLLGESGVGKELFAQSIHSASERRDCPFVAVNCGALPKELIESELFGYAGGAYSGARKEGSAGKFEAANGGTLFLDEIGELPATAQTALLRALQEGEITRVGEAHSRPVDVRIIAATNRDLGIALDEGRLRADLYYRLAVLTIELPPLRERREDIPTLAQHFLDRAATQVHRQGLTISPEAMAALQAYAWPGNVRELQNVISRAAALAPGSRITPGDLPPTIRGSGTAERFVSRSLECGGATTAAAGAGVAPFAEPVESSRARLLEIIASAGTMSRAAEALGITRSTLYRRLQRFGLQPKRVFGS